MNAALLGELCEQYGQLANGYCVRAEDINTRGWATLSEDERDEFARMEVADEREFTQRFAEPLYFGCEGDDPLNALAFDGRIGTRLNAVYGSDIGHWDVPVMADAVHETYELVEEGLLSESDFSDFVYGQRVRFWTRTNPAFFEGTASESAGARV